MEGTCTRVDIPMVDALRVWRHFVLCVVCVCVQGALRGAENVWKGVESAYMGVGVYVTVCGGACYSEGVLCILI